MSDIISDMHSFMLVRLVRDFFRQAVHLAIEVQLSRQNNGDFQWDLLLSDAIIVLKKEIVINKRHQK